MIDLACSDCDWDTAVEPSGDHYVYCPECGAGVDIETEAETLDPSETLSGSV